MHRGRDAPEDASSGVIVVADDDPTIRALFRRGLERAGFEVVEAADGPAALAAAQEPGVVLALVDRGMPGLDGSEVARRLRAIPATRTLPILLVTGRSAVEDRVHGLDAGADDYVVKPVDLHELVARVRSQLRSQETWAEATAELEHRAVVAEVLRAMPRGGSPAEVPTALCDELCARGLRGAGVVSLAGRSGAWLATAGDLAAAGRAGRELSPSAAMWLRRRCAQGPWVEPTDVLDAIGFGALFAELPDGLLAGAPMVAGDALLGAALCFDELPAAGTGRSGPLLSRGIDLAAVAAVVVGTELLTQISHDEGRGRLLALVAEGRFVPHFQPVVDLDTGRVVGYEALTRFVDGERPDVRFAAAHRLEVGAELERATAAAAIRESERLPPDCWLSVNASPVVLSGDGAFWSVLAGASRPVVVEVTEHDPVHDYNLLRSAFERARPRVTLAVDDAGTGYASLSHILRLDPTYVKIDAEWVRDLHDDPVRQALVAGMGHFAGVAGCALVAEGIESAAEMDVLRSLGVRYGQGFLLGRPQPIGELVG